VSFRQKLHAPHPLNKQMERAISSLLALLASDSDDYSDDTCGVVFSFSRVCWMTTCLLTLLVALHQPVTSTRGMLSCTSVRVGTAVLRAPKVIDKDAPLKKTFQAALRRAGGSLRLHKLRKSLLCLPSQAHCSPRSVPVQLPSARSRKLASPFSHGGHSPRGSCT
jgi:hypothetical protein